MLLSGQVSPSHSWSLPVIFVVHFCGQAPSASTNDDLKTEEKSAPQSAAEQQQTLQRKAQQRKEKR